MIQVTKKDGTLEVFDFTKIIKAVRMSADRIGKDFDDQKALELMSEVDRFIHTDTISVNRVHEIVEMALHKVDKEIEASYSGYRNYKKEMAEMMETVVTSVKKSVDERDRSNSNLNSLLFSARRTNVSKILLKEMFMKYFLKEKERQAVKDGFIYVHDMDNRLLGTHNCCVVKLENIMDGGFWINGFFCKEPKSITKAVSIAGDIIVSASSAQYGGYTAGDIDVTLAKYCKKSYDYWLDIFEGNEEKARKMTLKELEDAIQGLEFELNTRESSRGDFPFTTLSFGAGLDFWAREVSSTILSVRRKGHGDKVKQKVVFPKLVFRIRHDGKNDDIFDEAIYTSTKALYPDYIDDKVASPMGK